MVKYNLIYSSFKLVIWIVTVYTIKVNLIFIIIIGYINYLIALKNQLFYLEPYDNAPSLLLKSSDCWIIFIVSKLNKKLKLWN